MSSIYNNRSSGDPHHPFGGKSLLVFTPLVALISAVTAFALGMHFGLDPMSALFLAAISALGGAGVGAISSAIVKECILSVRKWKNDKNKNDQFSLN